ncbi:histidine phosphatase superfamily [Mortierella sp. GBAus27b]|nr:histidine phosphatase superfamily [Mortierella sp. GBAus27b]
MPNISLYFVRHGQRIDQVDPSWADTSPCRMDPPLTDLGKQQARLTGKRIRDLARNTSSLRRLQNDEQPQYRTIQGITPPGSPAFDRCHLTDAAATIANRPHHFAIITSPFLRCSQTATEMAIGMRMATQDVDGTMLNGMAEMPRNLSTRDISRVTEENKSDNDQVTIAVESGIAEWLSFEYVSEHVPDSIIMQRMQDFAKARRDHEQYYSIDWKYVAKERQLPSWPETREDMQERQDRALDHILKFYANSAKSKDYDLSIILVTHASPVNGTAYFTRDPGTLVASVNAYARI